MSEKCFDDAREQAEAARTNDAADLQTQCDSLEEDTLLLALGNARARREAADREIRHLLAYEREFHGRRAYGLDALAEASGMSLSGVRTAHTSREIDAVTRQIGRTPDSRRARPPAQADRS